MYFFEDTCMPDDEFEISFCEDALELNVSSHNVLNILGIYEQAIFEDGEESPSSNGVFEKLKSAILSLLDKIGGIVSGFLESMRVFSKDRITYDDYKNSETGQIQLSCDLIAMQKDIDAEYQRMRPIVSKIANITGKDIDKVERICDKVTENLHENRKRYARDITKVVSAAAVNKISENVVSKMDDVKEWRDKTKESVDRMKRDTSPALIRAYHDCIRCMGDIANFYKELGIKAKKALLRVDKKRKERK